MPRKLTLIALLVILTAALALRTAGLSRLVYANPDEGLWSYFIVTGAQLSWLSPHPAQNALAHILSWDYGYPLFVLDDLYVRALQTVGLPVSEATLPLPLAVFGTLNCLLVFLIAQRVARRVPTPAWPREDTRPHAALLAAALMAVMPLTVGRSRSIGGAEACSGFLFLLAALQVMRYLEAPADRRRQWLAGLCVGLYVCGDVQFLIGGTVLLGLVALWPLGEGADNGLVARLKLLWRPGVLVPPLLLFLPYVPAWLYAMRLGYPDQTYLGTVLAEHKADWGFHLIPFGHDLARNVGIFPLLALPLVFAYFLRQWRRPQQWLLLWIGLTAFPFLFAVTSKVTEASGYHEHLVAALAIAVAVALSALALPFGRPLSLEGPDIIRPAVASQATVGRMVSGPSNGIRLVTLIIVLGPLLVTLGGLFRVPALVPLWPEQKIPYGGLVPNSGMKTAGHWVRQNVSAQEPVFVAHDPAVAYWYMGRECVTGGLANMAQRKETLLREAPRIAVAVIPGDLAAYPPELMRGLGFTGDITVTAGGAPVLMIYTRRPVNATLAAEDGDRQYNAAVRTARAIIPPPWPYAPGKPIR